MDKDEKMLLAVTAATMLITLFVVFLSFQKDMLQSNIFPILLMAFLFLPLIAGGMYMWATGKGQWAIAGYNTMPKSHKSLYDAEKMSKDVGKLLVATCVITFAGVVMALLTPHTFVITFATVGLVTVLGLVSLFSFNKTDKYLIDPAKAPPPMTKGERKGMMIFGGFMAGVTVVIFVLVFFFVGSGDVRADLGEDGLGVEAPMLHEYVLYENIVSAELREDVDLGERVNGFGGSKVLSGKFRNGEFGNYTLACYKENKTCIVVERTGGRTLVFNLASAEETGDLYRELNERIS
jgi:hypothetical protein